MASVILISILYPIMNITIIGTGFVGVVSSAVYASFGHQVIGLDVDEKKIASLKKSKVPFYEPNLEELLTEQQKTGRLTFTTHYQTAIKDADVIIIAVGTPSAADGQADLKYVFASCEAMAEYLKQDAIVVVKSTVPPGTLNKVEKALKAKTKTKFHTASLPEFLKEGSAVADTLNPDRVIIGATNEFVFKKLEELHQPLKTTILRMNPNSAQMTKYTANSYLATRITFINQIADLCEKNGADVMEVIKGIGFDQRIGNHYWYPGLGYGGSCFPKDVKELAAYSRAVGESNNLLNKISQLNEERIYKLMDKFDQQVGGFAGKTVAVLGLSFKPHTDDLREAPATKIVPVLMDKGAKIMAFDPMAKYQPDFDNYTQVSTLPEACQKAEVIMALVEWPEIIGFDFATIKTTKKPYFIDARNQFDPSKIKAAGFKYIGIGR